MVLRRLLRMKAQQAEISGALEGGALSALRPAARLGTPASFLSDEMPIGLEKGIVMTMLRNAGSLKMTKNLICARSSSIPRQRARPAPTKAVYAAGASTKEFLPASHNQSDDNSVSAESTNMSRWVSSMIKV